MFVNGSGQNEQSLERTFHRCFLPSFILFSWGVSGEKVKMWKVNGRQTVDAKWWQKLTLPLARWAKKNLKVMKISKNCFRYLKLMSPLNAAICTTISDTLWVEWYYLKNNYLTLRSKVTMVRDTPHYGHAPTYQLSLTYLERQKCYGPDKKILFKKQLFDLEVKRRSLQYVTPRLMVMHPHTKYNWPIWKDKKVMVQTSFAEKKQKQKKRKQKKKSD
jgi:hypothetical protein